MILELIKNFLSPKQACKHEHVGVNCDFGYCPDCGALIENQWYIVKCSCCGLKHKAIIKNGKVVPVNNFCHNCGSEDYVIEKLETIDFININYAALVRKETKVTQPQKPVAQCWVDATRRNNEQPLLLPLYQ